jgi:hypothetical protein
MAEKSPKKQRITTGTTIDKELYQNLKIQAVKQDKKIGEVLDEAIKYYLASLNISIDNTEQAPDNGN